MYLYVYIIFLTFVPLGIENELAKNEYFGHVAE